MLAVNRVSQTFEGRERLVVDHVDFHLEKGDFCVIVGANGSGKSTLMNILSGLAPPMSGDVQLDGEDIRGCSHDIASVVQDVAQGSVLSMTLLENLTLTYMQTYPQCMQFYKHYEQALTKILHDMQIGLEAYLHKPLGVLSGGQRQLVAMVMAVISKPKLLLLDEHTSALDPHMQKKLMVYTQKAIVAQNMTAVMITHQLQDALDYGNKLLVMCDGRLTHCLTYAQKKQLDLAQLLTMLYTQPISIEEQQ